MHKTLPHGILKEMKLKLFKGMVFLVLNQLSSHDVLGNGGIAPQFFIQVLDKGE
jgi:hypothetical protein